MHTVALVGDCPYLFPTLAALLEPHGFRVVWFPTGVELLDRYDGSPGCVLMDIFLRQMDGFEVLRRFQERWGVPVIVMDAQPCDAHRQRAIVLGAFVYLAKPWETKELRTLLHRDRAVDVPTIVDRTPRSGPYWGIAGTPSVVDPGSEGRGKSGAYRSGPARAVMRRS